MKMQNIKDTAAKANREAINIEIILPKQFGSIHELPEAVQDQIAKLSDTTGVSISRDFTIVVRADYDPDISDSPDGCVYSVQSSNPIKIEGTIGIERADFPDRDSYIRELKARFPSEDWSRIVAD